MTYKLYITVHVYAEERLDDQILKPDSDNYGIIGKEIISPLRKVNGVLVLFENCSLSTTVQELWDYIDNYIFGNSIKDNKPLLEYEPLNLIVERYFLFNSLRYTIDKPEKPFIQYLQRMNVNPSEDISIQLLVNSNAGTIICDDGIRYYMHSKESGKHSLPHIHVEIRNESRGAFSIIDGHRLAGENIKKRDEKRIQKVINDNKELFIRHWNEHTDGLTVDLNQALKILDY